MEEKKQNLYETFEELRTTRFISSTDKFIYDEESDLDNNIVKISKDVSGLIISICEELLFAIDKNDSIYLSIPKDITNRVIILSINGEEIKIQLSEGCYLAYETFEVGNDLVGQISKVNFTKDMMVESEELLQGLYPIMDLKMEKLINYDYDSYKGTLSIIPFPSKTIEITSEGEYSSVITELSRYRDILKDNYKQDVLSTLISEKSDILYVFFRGMMYTKKDTLKDGIGLKTLDRSISNANEYDYILSYKDICNNDIMISLIENTCILDDYKWINLSDQEKEILKDGDNIIYRKFIKFRDLAYHIIENFNYGNLELIDNLYSSYIKAYNYLMDIFDKISKEFIVIMDTQDGLPLKLSKNSFGEVNNKISIIKTMTDKEFKKRKKKGK